MRNGGAFAMPSPDFHAAQDGETVVSVSRVISMFALTVPPLILVMVVYASLTEHVFGLSHFMGSQMGARTRRVLRAAHYVVSAAVSAVVQAALITQCGVPALVVASELPDAQLACPRVDFHELGCLASGASASLLLVLALFAERVSVPLLNLSHHPVYARGVVPRLRNAAAVVVVWLCMAEQQVGALLLLGLLSARRVLVHVPKLDRGYGMLIKLYTILNMSRVVSYKCPGSRRLVVATVIAILPL